jgi:uncharacterized membrane protein
MDQDNQNTGAIPEGHSHDDGHNHGAEAAQAAPVQTQASASTSSNDADVNDHKLFAILGYILPFLFFIPMVNDTSKNNPFARFHANQQLILLVIGIGFYVLSNVFYMTLGALSLILFPIANIAMLVLVVLGIINAAQGEMKELPLVGHFKLLYKVFKK